MIIELIKECLKAYIRFMYGAWLGESAGLARDIRITKTCLFKCIEYYTTKNENFQIKIMISFIFLLKT